MYLRYMESALNIQWIVKASCYGFAVMMLLTAIVAC